MSGGPSLGGELGGYRIQAVIGRGGMGVVYRAEHMTLGRTVALKVVAPELAADPDFRERFLREARLAASLDHPAVIPVHDAGEQDGVLFIAMRLVVGPDLATQLRSQGTPGATRTIDILAPVASALDAAHRRSLVHRDVKPANILIEPAGGPDEPERVFLTDFGLTKRTDTSSALTRTGMFVGTLEYAAPEQIKGEPLDGRTDQYALACVAFLCLVGVPPFRGDNDALVLYGHLEGTPPSASAARADLPGAVDPVLARGMAKRRDDRFDTCMSFIQELRAALAAGQTRPAMPPAAVPPTRVVPPARGVPPPPPSPTPPSPQPQPTPATVPWPPPQWEPAAPASAAAPQPAGWAAATLLALAGLIGLIAIAAHPPDQSAAAGALLAGPSFLLAVAFATSRGRGTQLLWSSLAVANGLWDAVVGVTATGAIVVVAALLSWAGAAMGFRSASNRGKTKA